MLLWEGVSESCWIRYTGLRWVGGLERGLTFGTDAGAFAIGVCAVDVGCHVELCLVSLGFEGG